jgi:hypothetical protein
MTPSCKPPLAVMHSLLWSCTSVGLLRQGCYVRVVTSKMQQKVQQYFYSGMPVHYVAYISSCTFLNGCLLPHACANPITADKSRLRSLNTGLVNMLGRLRCAKSIICYPCQIRAHGLLRILFWIINTLEWHNPTSLVSSTSTLIDKSQTGNQ